ncbi:BrnT family toxin [Halodesulfovibrio sp.]|jgi:uncharacterized DUF497 family protein|uniref:BrnT family toxin n=1 Tax=Halodesulfovibrio sp. TaxID=1912772 RepID=UPI0025E81082|nr:BrnT family toxin [Halodesulfovibrio sp.]MCT4625675.1 BrnT family toxin [Halodesulfovibrio sp.]
MCDQNVRFIPGVTSVEYDPEKEDTNIAKHGYSLSCAVDLIEAWILLQQGALWQVYERNEEERFSMLTEYQDGLVHLTATMRDNDVVRVISMRDASRTERQEYEETPPQVDLKALLGC